MPAGKINGWIWALPGALAVLTLGLVLIFMFTVDKTQPNLTKKGYFWTAVGGGISTAIAATIAGVITHKCHRDIDIYMDVMAFFCNSIRALALMMTCSCCLRMAARPVNFISGSVLRLPSMCHPNRPKLSDLTCLCTTKK